MQDFEKRLEDFGQKCEDIFSQEFENFGYMEKAYCELINEGGILRQYLLQNPSLCDKNSLLVLTNQVHDVSYLADKYKCLSKIIDLTVVLLKKYSEYVKQVLAENNYSEAINIYNQMFNFTRNYQYKKEIAEIYLRNLNDIDKASEICAEIEPFITNKMQFLKLYAEICEQKGDKAKYENLIRQQKEYELKDKLQKCLNETDYLGAISVNEELFKFTGDYKYKKDIANIHAACFSDIDKALSMYKKLENKLSKDPQYWWQRSDLYRCKDAHFRQVLCIQKALKLELQNLENNEGEATV